ncbi:hypothetical protein DL93DRAFT_2070113 [Clavulina sp. PMI_390]|nr:hypothetical protein DL93DRAFT_2070113 [Clavulina sp. PMI_390]
MFATLILSASLALFSVAPASAAPLNVTTPHVRAVAERIRSSFARGGPEWGIGSYVDNPTALAWYNSDLNAGTSGVDPTAYTCFAGNVNSLPPISQWMSFTASWARQQQYSLGNFDTSTQQTQIHDAIVQVSQESKVDARLILAVIMQESTGNVNVACTAGFNCGLMQAYKGSVSYDSGNSAASILQMVRDGTEGTSQGPGYVQYLDGGSAYAYTNCNLGNPYDAARAYNTGSCSTSGNLHCARYGTASYVNDVANRLIGWNGNGSPQGACGFPAVGCV